MDNKEKNRIQLKRSIQNLPEHKAPDGLWESMNRQMQQEEKDIVLKKALSELPVLEADDAIWNEIEAKLDKKVGRVRVLQNVKWLAAASVIGLALIWFVQPREQGETYAESIQFETKELTPVKWSGDDPSSDRYVSVVMTALDGSYVKDLPKTKALKGSLEQLNTAIAQVETAGEQIGLSEHMQRQLTKMFIKRNKLVRQLAAII